MTDLFRVTTLMNGFPGAPGYNNLFFIHADPPSTAAQQAVTKVRAFWEAVANQFAAGWTYQIQSDVAVVSDVDGTISSFISTTPPAQSTGAGSGAYAGGAGAHVSFLTTGVVNSHKVRGGLFLVPLNGSAYDATGTLGSITLAQFQTAAEGLRTGAGPALAVWSRPFELKPPATKPPTRAGSSFAVTATRVVDKTAILRSRRD
jgi:hypothetical protein